MNRVYLNQLFDYYHSLLTANEQDIFQKYYEEDLTLQEIADEGQISKSAISKTLKTVEKKLLNYEEKLLLNHNRIEINKLLHNKIDNELLEKVNKYI